MKKMKIERLPELSFEVSEALNQLRINLGFCGTEVKTIMMTSSVPDEGKSFLTLQLWKMMAELGNSVLLIDCDFRRSQMRTRYGFSFSGTVTGGAHYLAGRAELEDVIYETNVPGGYLIPVAKTVANPTILLENPRFAEMVKACRQRFDVILIDTPPLGSVADALKIVTHCDGAVMVVRSGQTPRRVVTDSLQLLQRTGRPLLGVVLNRAAVNEKSNLYYRRYYKSGYYYKGEGTKAPSPNKSNL